MSESTDDALSRRGGWTRVNSETLAEAKRLEIALADDAGIALERERNRADHNARAVNANADLIVRVRAERDAALAALERVRALCDEATWRRAGVVVVSVERVRAATTVS